MIEVWVVATKGDGHEVRKRVRADAPIHIGRRADATVCLDSDAVSRQHAVLEILNDGIQVTDQSTNGTVAGDQVLRRTVARVAFGMPIGIGDFQVVIHVAEEAEYERPRSAAPAKYAPVPHSPVAHSPSSLPKGPQGRSHESGRPPKTTAPPRVDRIGAIGALEANEVNGAIGVAARSANSNPVEVDPSVRREIHKRLLEHLDLAALDSARLDDPSLRHRVVAALDTIASELRAQIPRGANKNALIQELADEALGLGPLEQYLNDPTVSEIMVVDTNTVYVERAGRLVLTPSKFTDEDRVRSVIERIITPLGRRIDESSPLVDARLPDGSRVNAIIRPLALRGPCITIRKFTKNKLGLDDLIKMDSLSRSMAVFLTRSVIARKNIIVSGGTGSGKTTLLNVLSAAIPSDERIVTIEDAAELKLKQPHVVSLETRPGNAEGQGEYTIRDLLHNALRMRPDRIVIGECRGGEALDMLQAMNTGHDGSLTTTHANSPREAVARLETLALMSGLDLPSRAIREQIATSIDLVIQQVRMSDGSRRLSSIAEVVGIDEAGEVTLRPIFEFVRRGTADDGKVVGDYRATGYLPSYLHEFLVLNLVRPGEAYL